MVNMSFGKPVSPHQKCVREAIKYADKKGVNIYATYPKQSYGSLNGTSMAAPVVSGVAIALKSYYPNLSSHEIRQLLIDSVTKHDELKELSMTSEIINMYEAFRLAEGRYGAIK